MCEGGYGNGKDLPKSEEGLDGLHERQCRQLADERVVFRALWREVESCDENEIADLMRMRSQKIFERLLKTYLSIKMLPR